MNLVDQTIALFSPRAALRREVARQKLTAFSRFDAAKISRARPQARRNMPAEQIGGTTERIRLMNRARDLDDNFSTVRAILTHFVIHTTGSLAYQARTGDTGLDQQVEAYLREWFRNCDITGRHSLQCLTQLVFRSVLVDGDCGVLVTRQDGELKLQTVTADRIGKDTDLDSLDPFYVGGITIDGVGRPLSYRVFSRDKFGTYRDPQDIDAEMFCHVANFTRPDEYRGRSALAAILDDAQDVSDLIEYEKLAARWASSQAGVIKTEYGADEEMASVLRGDKDQFGNDTKLTALEPGRVNYLNTGESMEMFKSGDRPAQAFANFVQYIENRMCRAMGTSARVILDRPSAGPESRKDLRQAERTFDFWRRQMETQMLNKVVRLALLDAAARGILPSNPEVVRGEWQWPGSVSIDAGRDARADIELWRMGLATAAELYGEAGHDWQASMRQRAKEAAYIRELSVEMDVTPPRLAAGWSPLRPIRPALRSRRLLLASQLSSYRKAKPQKQCRIPRSTAHKCKRCWNWRSPWRAGLSPPKLARLSLPPPSLCCRPKPSTASSTTSKREKLRPSKCARQHASRLCGQAETAHAQKENLNGGDCFD
jgi:capsid protein